MLFHLLVGLPRGFPIKVMYASSTQATCLAHCSLCDFTHVFMWWHTLFLYFLSHSSKYYFSLRVLISEASSHRTVLGDRLSEQVFSGILIRCQHGQYWPRKQPVFLTECEYANWTRIWSAISNSLYQKVSLSAGQFSHIEYWKLLSRRSWCNTICSVCCFI